EADARGSVAFDAAADYYDETKALPPDALAATIDLLAAELGGSARVLDVGVGTGLLALPLVERGLHVDGVDLSAPMLRRATAKAAPCTRVGLTVADATHLPFRGGAFDGAFMRHVLHLVPGWQQVLAEAVRVVRPGGKLVVSITDYTGLYREIQGRFLLEAGGLPLSVGLRPDDPGSLRRAMLGLGARVRPLPVVRGRRTLTVDRFLTGIEDGQYSWTWPATDERRRHAARRLRAWLVRRFGDLGRPVEPRFAVEWWAFDLSHRVARRQP
ncbi:MAG: class I SAM-dependent methyltransferase, partial [Actinomycetota bacterium]